MTIILLALCCSKPDFISSEKRKRYKKVAPIDFNQCTQNILKISHTGFHITCNRLMNLHFPEFSATSQERAIDKASIAHLCIMLALALLH